MPRDDSVVRCSFCNKTQDEVDKLIAGPGVYICDECVELCSDIIFEDAELRAAIKRNSKNADEKPLPKP